MFSASRPIATASMACVFLWAAPVRALAQGANEIPMADYLGLLAQIAPAARDGAVAFVEAHRQRCGRELSSGELRTAMASGSGDPVLMAMIRASQMRDAKSLAALGSRVTCRGASR